MSAAVSPPSPAERLAVLIEGLCAAVAAHGARGLLTVPLLLLLWSRLSRMAQRARRLAKRMATGRPVSPPRPVAPRAAPSRPYLRLPRGVLWLVRAVPGTASGAATLQFLLDQPDMTELAQFPPMRRLLRPLCRMLGVDAPPITPPPPPQLPAPIARANDPPRPPSEPPRHAPPTTPLAAIPRNAV